ncbi:MAG: Fe(2+) transporter FeoB [Chloroflexi bacterium]|nr:Fe(2+) transporter FeoB [Chloroflexota bacterium]
MRLALIGQPNAGKSTLFNQVAGYKAETGNFPGTTVTYTESTVRILGEAVELVDLPGTYSLSAASMAEQEAIRYLASHKVDAIINLVDASHLVQGLSLTLELLELGNPVVVGMNMMDEAARLGFTIDGELLQNLLGVPVLPLVANRGQGIQRLFTKAFQVAQAGEDTSRIPYKNKVLEEAVQSLAGQLENNSLGWASEALAIRLLENGESLFADVEKELPQVGASIQEQKKVIVEGHGNDPEWAFAAERHAQAQELTSKTVIKGEERVTWQTRLDDVLLHPFWGYLVMLGILWLFFQGVYTVGSWLEGPLLTLFDSFSLQLPILLGGESFWTKILVGGIQGIAGGVAIVLPYLIPFLLGMGFLEDVGYLPRLAFMTDALMHRLGLHGKAIVPFILGYGCNVPAVMSTRTLRDRQDRFLSALLATMVPCAARLSIVFGLVAFYLGPVYAVAIYVLNILVIAIVGRILSMRVLKGSPGLILEVPPYRLPTLKTVVQKAWFRIREFVVEAWPLLIVGSVILEIANILRLSKLVNILFRPLTWALGLPSPVGMPLVFGILRKELSLIMLRQALDVTDFSAALSPQQMLTFTVFVVFYVPCVATLGALRKELGARKMWIITGLTVVIALAAGLFTRLLAEALSPVLGF